MITGTQPPRHRAAAVWAGEGSPSSAEKSALHWRCGHAGGPAEQGDAGRLCLRCFAPMLYAAPVFAGRAVTADPQLHCMTRGAGEEMARTRIARQEVGVR